MSFSSMCSLRENLFFSVATVHSLHTKKKDPDKEKRVSHRCCWVWAKQWVRTHQKCMEKSRVRWVLSTQLLLPRDKWYIQSCSWNAVFDAGQTSGKKNQSKHMDKHHVENFSVVITKLQISNICERPSKRKKHACDGRLLQIYREFGFWMDPSKNPSNCTAQSKKSLVSQRNCAESARSSRRKRNNEAAARGGRRGFGKNENVKLSKKRWIWKIIRNCVVPLVLFSKRTQNENICEGCLATRVWLSRIMRRTTWNCLWNASSRLQLGRRTLWCANRVNCTSSTLAWQFTKRKPPICEWSGWFFTSDCCL